MTFAQAEIAVSFPLFFVCALVLGLAALAYGALKLDRGGISTMVAFVAVAVGLLLFGYRSAATQSGVEAKLKAQKDEQAAARMYERFQRPLIDLKDESYEKSSSKLVAAKTKKPAEEKKASSDSKQTKARPAWVDQTPKRVGNVYRKVVVTDPFATVEECYEQLQGETFPEVVNARIDELASSNRYAPNLERLGLGSDFVWREVCLEDEWVETLDTSVGDMKRIHVLMEFDAAVDRQIADAYRDYERRFRVSEVGGLAGIGLGSLALLFGLLKVDTWTKGYYSKRLFFGVPAVIIAIVAFVTS